MSEHEGCCHDSDNLIQLRSAAKTQPKRARTPLRVYFNEFNVRMGKYCYLPLVSGLLRAYAETSETIRKNYAFMPFLYCMDSVPAVLSEYDSPDVAAFSACMWNEQLNLRVAAEVKRRWPHCLVVFGGPQVPHHAEAFLRQHEFIDVTVRAEGEEAFSDILHRHLESDDFGDIPGVSFRDKVTGRPVLNHEERPYVKDLDAYPSPYLGGLYDDLLARQSDTLAFQAIIETNRGCPFLCTFCYWGRGGLTRKYRYHGLDRVYAEIDWFGRNRLTYVFNADSNFGMHARDMDIAQFIVATKKKYGYPDKFRTCFGKNTDEKIFAIGSLFHKNGLEKGITLARQSNDEETLKNIKRSNIKLATYRNLQTRFNDEDIPIYSELILGLPGETVESWKRGIDELLEAGLKNQLFIYLCQVYPNTELGDPEYQRRFGVQTKRVPLTEIHGLVRDREWEPEYEDVVVATNSLSHADWKDMVVFSALTMLLHSMKAGFFILSYLIDRFRVQPSDLIGFVLDAHARAGASVFGAEIAEYRRLLGRMLDHGEGRGTDLPGYGDMYWDVEEASFLRLAENFEAFYEEFYRLVAAFLRERQVAFDADELRDVVRYQHARMPARRLPARTKHTFSYNVPEYFDSRFSSAPVALLPVQQTLTLTPRDFGGDCERFARETILWGRKSGTMLVPCSYESEALASVS